MSAPIQQYFPGFPANIDPSLRKTIQHLYDRINYLIGQVETGRQVPSEITRRIGTTEVALQAVQDALTTGSAFVNFGQTQPISGTISFTASGIGLLIAGPSTGATISVTNAATTRAAISAAQSGSNSDITFLNVLLGIYLLDSTPAQITANQNNYNPGTGSSFRLDLDAAWSITGFDNGTDGRIIMFVNISAFDLTLEHQDVGSDPENRIITGTGAGVIYPSNCFGIIKYDDTTDRWRVVI